MKRTERLGLPIFDNPSTDRFGLDEWNYANQTIDEAYDEIDNIRKEIPKVNANAELVEARMGKATLGEKMTEVSTSLEQKANKNDVFTMSNMGQDIKEAMTGGSVSVVGKNTILEENVVDSQITPRKVSFLEPSPNLFDISKSKFGYYRVADGVFISSETVKSSDFIRVEKNINYYWNTTNKPSVTFFDANLNYVSGIASNGWTTFFTIPDNDLIKYVCVTFSVNEAKLNVLMLTKGKAYDKYISYNEVTTKSIKLEKGIVDYETLSADLKTSILTGGFENKSILLFGDSITETASMNDDGSNYVEGFKTNYPKFLNDRFKFKKMTNYAKSGASYRNRNLEFRQFVGNQIDTAITNKIEADIIILSVGTNDGGASFLENLDTYEEAINKEISALNKTKIHQSIRYAMYRIRENYPNAICFCSTPLQRADREPILELSNAIKKMANRYNFIVIDAENESGILKDFEVWQEEGRFLRDGLHPNQNGQILEANLFEAYLKMYC